MKNTGNAGRNRKPTGAHELIATAMTAGVSELGAHRLLRSIRDLARASKNGSLDDATVRARAEALAWGAS